MKLASYKDGSRDGQLVVVSRDLGTAHYATGIATRLQQVLDDWGFMSPQLEDLYQTLNQGKARHAFAFDPAWIAVVEGDESVAYLEDRAQGALAVMYAEGRSVVWGARGLHDGLHDRSGLSQHECQARPQTWPDHSEE